VDVSANPDDQLSGVAVAAFTVPNVTDPANEFEAIIDWGDGTTSAGTVEQVTPGLFVVRGDHAFADGGTYPVSVSVLQHWSEAKRVARQQGQAQVGRERGSFVGPDVAASGVTLFYSAILPLQERKSAADVAKITPIRD
jgi:hypothetical protein